MSLKFRKYVHGQYTERKRSALQKKQWALFAAIGYSIAIRGYLICWKDILKRAGFDASYTGAIDNLITMSKAAEQRARYNIKHLKEVPFDIR